MLKIKTLLLCDSLAGLSWASRSTALGFSLAGLSWASGSMALGFHKEHNSGHKEELKEKEEINTKEEMRTIKINRGETECGDLVRLINASLVRLMADEST